MFSIGEFSRLTGLTVKTLRFYHEKGILVPACVDDQTGYRYYCDRQIDRARIITSLRGLEFTLEQISSILGNQDETDILDHLEQQKALLDEKMRKYKLIVSSLDQIIRNEREARMAMHNSTFEVEEKTLDTLLIAGVRLKGHYSDSGKGFSRIGKALGRHICGKCFLLHYDTEFREQEADFEACMPVRNGEDVEGISVRELPGGRCVSLMHKGPYEEMSRSYARIMTYIKEKGYEILMPTREVYLKGPGMIFWGNPRNYLTEIQMLIKQPENS